MSATGAHPLTGFAVAGGAPVEVNGAGECPIIPEASPSDGGGVRDSSTS